MVRYIVKVRKSSAYGEAFLGSQAYTIMTVSREQLTPQMQVVQVLPDKNDLNTPKKNLNRTTIQKYDKNRPVPIRDRVTSSGSIKHTTEPKHIAPHTLAPAPGYKKPFDYKLWNTLRRLHRVGRRK